MSALSFRCPDGSDPYRRGYLTKEQIFVFMDNQPVAKLFKDEQDQLCLPNYSHSWDIYVPIDETGANKHTRVLLQKYIADAYAAMQGLHIQGLFG